ncbi:outer membrane efflux protein [hydrothermal vent metagenome]|uniref:Outer membrane efflux protein n=1 Tax=hydrothermal vent metagenome TaxID=652676 RepID=A0A1W1BQI3_9ZZZZ
MLKQIVIVSLLSLVAHADMLGYFQEANRHLQYDKTYSLYKQSNQLSQNGIEKSQYANFSVDVGYARTRAKLLDHGFNTTDFSLNDTLDVFGKNSYKIEMLQLDLKSKKASLSLQKEQLFVSLVTMIEMYHRTVEQHALYQTLFNRQNKIYKKLRTLEKNGDISNLDVLRFNNTLSRLQAQIVSLENQAIKMKKQLKLYVPNQPIPSLHHVKLRGSKKAFLAHNPQYEINSYDAHKKNVQAKGMQKSYIPTVTTGVAYQQLDDPTSYGDNYSFNIGLHMPLNQGEFKEAEALKVAALSSQSRSIEMKLQRENEYISRHQAYLNAKKEMAVLKHSLQSYKKSEKSIKEAYLKQYVDFNTYLQVLTESLAIKEQIIALRYQRDLEATIINAIGSGKIYE